MKRNEDQVWQQDFKKIFLHCCAHSSFLLQDIGRQLLCIQDALERVKEISKAIFSSKILHLFSIK